MKNHFLFLGFVCLFCSWNILEATDEPPAQEVDEIAKKGIQRIHSDLGVLAKTYSILKDIDKVDLFHSKPLSKPSSRITHGFSFRKGVVTKPNETASSNVYMDVIPSEGIILDVGVGTPRGHIGITRDYGLDNSIHNLRVSYYVEEKPTNEALRKAIREIVEKNVELLKKELAELEKSLKDSSAKPAEADKK